MEIAAWTPEQQTTDSGKNGVAEIPMQRGHGTRHDSTAKAIPHHQFIALAQPLDESWDVREVVAIIRVPHNDILSACGSNAA